MSKYRVIKLTNLSPLHIGTGRENYDFSSSSLSSDAISAALASIRASLGRDSDINSFLSSFTISSAFPFVGSQYFLPNLQRKINVSTADEETYRKRLKKVKYIESSIWQKMVSGDTIAIEENQLQKEFLINDTISFAQPSKSAVNQRVKVSTGELNNDPFFFEWTYFNENAGLYCIVQADDDLFTEIVRLFTILGSEGIGTDKNIGGGKFNVDVAEIVLDEPNNANAQFLLSTYIPTKDEIQNLNIDNSAYELILRNGYMAGSTIESLRHLRKKSIYMFNSGSVFATTQQLSGKIVNLAPVWNDERLHPVYRSGRPLCFKIKI
jgi:CRISPR type III-A-associated RAMP protein Csm4